MKQQYTLSKAFFVFTAIFSSSLFSYGQAPIKAITSVNVPAPAVVSATSQKTVEGRHGNHTPCVTDVLTRRMMEEKGLQALYEQGRQEREQTSIEPSASRAVRTIPVVFHVVYDNASATNVSDAVIYRLIDRMNEDFRKNNPRVSNIRSAFTSVTADVEIEFCLATKDPSGNTTSGINRRLTTLTWFDSDANDGINYASGGVGGPNSMKGATYGILGWDRSKYVNIWIADITNGAQSGTAAYAYLPPCASLACVNQIPAEWDGVVLDYNIGVDDGYSSTISHEIGHYLGLPHTFASNSYTYQNPTPACPSGLDDDGFSDTPQIRGPFHGNYGSCGSATTAQSCTSGQLWQYENFMDYGYCESMFTTQQSNHMNSVLTNGRSGLLTSAVTNCAPPTAPPVAAFNGCNSNVAENSVVTFTDISSGAPTSWLWTITPATGWSFESGFSATSQNPRVRFTTQGTYSISLRATNTYGNNTITNATCVTVVPPGTCNNLSTAYTMGFEASESIAGWFVENTNGDSYNGDDITWGLVSNTFFTNNSIPASARTGDRCAAYAANPSLPADDWLTTPCFELKSGVTYTLRFWYRATYSAAPERMKVAIGTSSASTALTQTVVNLNNITNTNWIESVSTFTVPSNGNYYVGFHAYSTTNGYILLLDDINITAPAPQVPVADFIGCNSNVLANSTVTFTDVSQNIPTSWLWTITPATGWNFTGGTNANSQNPQVQFTTPGNYSVSLRATNAQGNNTKTTSNCVTVAASSTCNDLSTPLFMGFETSEDLAGWIVENTNNDQAGGVANTWRIFGNQTGFPAYAGTNFIGYPYNNTNVSIGADDWFFTPCLYMEPGYSYSLSFWYRVRESSGTTYPEKLKVMLGSNSSSISMAQTIQDLGTLSNLTWQQGTYTFTVTASGNYHVGFHCYSDADRFLLGVDNINLSKTAIPVPPVADFTGCTSSSGIALGSNITFTNASTNNPTSYAWSITPATGWSYTGGTNASSANPQVTFNTAGTYSVSLTATNSSGSNTKTSTGCVVVNAPVVVPVADFTGCTTSGGVTEGTTITFNNTSTNNPTSYAWSITPATGWTYAGGTLATSANPQVTFNTAGTYSVSLIATNSAGSNTKSSTGCVVVNAPVMAPVADFTGCTTSGGVTEGTTITFNNTSTNNPTSYAWSITPATGWTYAGGTLATSANPQITFNTAGTYSVSLIATNSAGSNTKTSTGCVVVNASVMAPVADFTGCTISGGVTEGTTITFNNTSTNNPTSYAWSITPATGWTYAGGTTATSANPEVTFTAAGSYTVSLTATNSAGNDTKMSTNCVVVNASIVAPVADFAGCGTYSANATVTLTSTSTNNPTSYAWSITPATGWAYAGGTNSSSANPQIAFTASGIYSVSLTATNAAGADTKTNATCIEIATGIVPPNAGFSGCGTFNNGSTVTLSNTSTNGASSYAWNIIPSSGWSYVNGTNSGSPSPQIIFTVDGTYDIELTATNSAGSDVEAVSGCVVITTAGIAPVADFLGCPGTISPNTVVTFANTSVNSPTSNTWTITPATGWNYTGGTGAGTANIQVEFLAVGSYTVKLTASNAQGNSTKEVVNCAVVTNVGIDESSWSNNITIYPNPTTGLTTLKIGEAVQYANLQVKIYNAIGKEVHAYKGHGQSEISLDMSILDAGIYFVEINVDGFMANKRVVVAR